MALQAGRAELPIVPTLVKSFSRDLASKMAGPATKTANKAGTDAGRTFGQRFTRTTGAAMERGGDSSARRFGLRFNKRLGGGFSAAARVAQKSAGLIGAAFAGAAVVGGIKSAITAASDLNETLNKNTVVFGSSAAAIVRWSRKSATSFGLSQNAALAAAAQFGEMFHQLGFTQKQSAKTSTSLVKMAADLGSFHNVDPSDVLDRIGAALRGEYDSLQQLIPNINAARVEQVALAQSHKKSVKDITAAEKATAVLTIVQRDGANAIGDFAKTSDNAANRQRILAARLEDTKAAIGKSLLPAYNAILGLILNKVIPATAKWIAQFRDDLLPHLGRMKDAWDANKGALLGLVTGLAGSSSQLTETGTKAKTLADAVVALSNAAGNTARVMTNLGNGLNATDAFLDRLGASIFKNATDPANKAAKSFGEWLGVNQLVGRIARDVSADLGDLGVNFTTHKAAIASATSSSYSHVAALQAEKLALEALKGALAGSQGAELDLRQASLNLATAQKRLTDLVRSGHKGSLEYRQAVIDEARAKIDVKQKTEAYRVAQRNANAATAGAMHATQLAAPAVKAYGEAAHRAGLKLMGSGVAAREGMGIANRAVQGFQRTINGLHGKKFSITAEAAVRVNESVRLYAKLANVPGFHATGGPIHGPGTGTSDSVPIWASAGEHMWTAKEVKAAGGHGAVEAMRAQVVRGYRSGGPVLDVPVKLTKSGDILKQFYHPVESATRRMGQKITSGFAKLIGDGLSKAINEGIGGGKAGIKAFIRSVDSHPYVWGGVGPGGYDCSGLSGEVYARHLGKPSFRRYFTTSSNFGAAGFKPGPGGVLTIGVNPGHHMAGRYGGMGFEAESTATGIKVGAAASPPGSFARQYHLAKGGRVKAAEELARLGVEVGGDPSGMWLRKDKQLAIFDRGGWLMPGQLGVNRTSSPERVVGPRETLIDYDKLADKIAFALTQRPIRASVDANQARFGLREAQRRDGIRHDQQVR